MLSKFLNRYVWNPYALDDEAQEGTWVDTKVKLLVTCPNKQEQTYSSLYGRSKTLLLAIVDRHKHFVLDAEAKSPLYYYISSGTFRRIGAADVSGLPLVMLPGLILLSYAGGRTKTTVGDVFSDPSFVIRAIDYLMDKQLPIGLFLKGFVLKYGIELFLPPNIGAAKTHLLAAQANGIGSAAIELQYMHIHESRYSTISSIHVDHNGYQKWVNNASTDLSMWPKSPSNP